MGKVTFTIGQAIRYKPGFGTYGYEDALEADGRVPGVVLGFTRTRVRIRTRCNGGETVRAVDAASLAPAPVTHAVAPRAQPPGTPATRV